MRRPEQHTASVNSVTALPTYTTVAAAEWDSTAVTMATNAPRKINATPSVIHSMVTMRRLSTLMSPNPDTTDRVGNR